MTPIVRVNLSKHPDLLEEVGAVAIEPPSATRARGWLLRITDARTLATVVESSGSPAGASMAEALSESSHETDQLNLVALLAFKRAVAGATDQATELVTAWRTRWQDNEAMLDRLETVSVAVERVVEEVSTQRDAPR